MENESSVVLCRYLQTLTCIFSCDGSEVKISGVQRVVMWQRWSNVARNASLACWAHVRNSITVLYLNKLSPTLRTNAPLIIMHASSDGALPHPVTKGIRPRTDTTCFTGRGRGRILIYPGLAQSILIDG